MQGYINFIKNAFGTSVVSPFKNPPT